MRLTARFAAALMTVVLTLAMPVVRTAATPSAADMTALKNFHLTESFLSRYRSFELEAAKHPRRYGRLRVMTHTLGKQHVSLDRTATAYDAPPVYKRCGRSTD